MVRRKNTYPTVNRLRNITICAQWEPLIFREPKTSAPMQEPTANMASCRPRKGSSPMDFIVAVIDTSKEVKLMLNTMNTASRGNTPA